MVYVEILAVAVLTVAMTYLTGLIWWRASGKRRLTSLITTQGNLIQARIVKNLSKVANEALEDVDIAKVLGGMGDEGAPSGSGNPLAALTGLMGGGGGGGLEQILGLLSQFGGQGGESLPKGQHKPGVRKR